MTLSTHWFRTFQKLFFCFYGCPLWSDERKWHISAACSFKAAAVMTLQFRHQARCALSNHTHFFWPVCNEVLMYKMPFLCLVQFCLAESFMHEQFASINTWLQTRGIVGVLLWAALWINFILIGHLSQLCVYFTPLTVGQVWVLGCVKTFYTVGAYIPTWR